jgi:hypothetical protein
LGFEYFKTHCLYLFKSLQILNFLISNKFAFSNNTKIENRNTKRKAEQKKETQQLGRPGAAAQRTSPGTPPQHLSPLTPQPHQSTLPLTSFPFFSRNRRARTPLAPLLPVRQLPSEASYK